MRGRCFIEGEKLQCFLSGQPEGQLARDYRMLLESNGLYLPLIILPHGDECVSVSASNLMLSVTLHRRDYEKQLLVLCSGRSFVSFDTQTHLHLSTVLTPASPGFTLTKYPQTRGQALQRTYCQHKYAGNFTCLSCLNKLPSHLSVKVIMLVLQSCIL